MISEGSLWLEWLSFTLCFFGFLCFPLGTRLTYCGGDGWWSWVVVVGVGYAYFWEILKSSFFFFYKKSHLRDSNSLSLKVGQTHYQVHHQLSKLFFILNFFNLTVTGGRSDGRMCVCLWTWVLQAFFLSFRVSRQPYWQE